MSPVALSEIAKACESVRAICEIKKLPQNSVDSQALASEIHHSVKNGDDFVFVIAYSLGAVWSELNLSSHISHRIYIAPAFQPKKQWMFLQLLSQSTWFKNIKLPSLNLRQYRECSHTSFDAYNQMFAQSAALQQKPTQAKVHRLIFANRQDELVDYEQLKNWVEYNMNENLLWVEIQKTNHLWHKVKNRIAEHLMVDEFTLGKESWAQVRNQIINYLKTSSENTAAKLK